MQATISQLVTEYQSHSGAVNTSTSPKVQYAYSDGSANHVRRTSLTYPSTKVVTYDYGTSNGGDDLLSRVAALKESTTTLVEYSYLGLSTFVRANYSSQPGVELTYIKQGAEGTGDAGDQYTGLDRFGRVYDQRWLVTSSGTAVDRFQYGFDRNSNRVFRDNLVASSGQDEYYSYDNLNQLSVLKRGDLNAGRTDISGTPVWQENFTFDPTGNWHGSSSGYVTRTSGVIDLDQNRSNNPVNEITGFTTTTGTGWATPAYNAAGNMTTMPQPASLSNGYTAQYDAWNRMVELKNGTTTVATYRYDGATRRVTKLVGSNTTHFYYSDQWQILEERLNTGSSADRQFVWGQRYIDDLVLRDQSSTRHYVLNDHVNVTSIINTSGTVQERYGYNAFGTSRVMNASFVVQSSSSYNWETRFAAYRWDSESGLYQVRYRYYHPLLGTWINRDPIGENGGLNLYGFVNNRPISNIDPDGRNPIVVGSLIVGVGVGLGICGNNFACRIYRNSWFAFGEGEAHRNAPDESRHRGRGAVEGGDADALTHCISACNMAKNPGPCGGLDRALDWLQRREVGNAIGTQLDRMNNENGFAIGMDKPANCTQACLDALGRGLLNEIRNGQIVPSSIENQHQP